MKRFILLITIISLTACDLLFRSLLNDIDQEMISTKISGYAFYNNSENSKNIEISVIKSNSGELVNSTTTDQLGYYSVDGLDAGEYTIYASSENSLEKIVYGNFNIIDNQEVSVSNLELTAIGHISGTIQTDNSNSGNMGYIVMISGSSYLGITDDTGYFNITDVPTSNGYVIYILQGNFIKTLQPIDLNVGEHKDLGTIHISSLEISGSNNLINWLGTFDTPPENPVKNCAYYNSTNNNSYLFDGVTWVIISQGVVGEDGLTAYEIWLELGNEGTEEDFILYLQNISNPQPVDHLEFEHVLLHFTKSEVYIGNDLISEELEEGINHYILDGESINYYYYVPEFDAYYHVKSYSPPYTIVDDQIISDQSITYFALENDTLILTSTYEDSSDLDNDGNFSELVSYVSYATILYDIDIDTMQVCYLVHFDTDDGSDVGIQLKLEGELVTEPDIPNKDGYIFSGWYKDIELTTLWDFNNDLIYSDTTIYAGWINDGSVPYFNGSPYFSTSSALVGETIQVFVNIGNDESLSYVVCNLHGNYGNDLSVTLLYDSNSDRWEGDIYIDTYFPNTLSISQVQFYTPDPEIENHHNHETYYAVDDFTPAELNILNSTPDTTPPVLQYVSFSSNSATINDLITISALFNDPETGMKEYSSYTIKIENISEDWSKYIPISYNSNTGYWESDFYITEDFPSYVTIQSLNAANNVGLEANLTVDNDFTSPILYIE